MTRTQKVVALAWRVPVLIPVGIAAIGVSVLAFPITAPIAFVGWRAGKRYLDIVDDPGDTDELGRCIAFCFALAAMGCTLLPLFGVAIASRCWDRTLAPLRAA